MFTDIALIEELIMSPLDLILVENHIEDIIDR